MSNCCNQYPNCGCTSRKPLIKPTYIPPAQPSGVGPAMFCDIEKAIAYVKQHANSCGCQHVCEKEDADEFIRMELELCAIACKACEANGGYFYSPYLFFINQLTLNLGNVVKESLGDESYTYDSTDSTITRLQTQHNSLLEKLGCKPCKQQFVMPTLTTGRVNILPPRCKNRCKGRCKCA